MFEKHIEQLGDFAIFARMDYAASPAAPAQSGEPVAWFHNTSPNGDKPHYEQVADEYARPPAIPLYTAPQSSQPVEAGDPCEHCKVNRPYHDLDCPVAAKVLAEKSAVVLDDERAAWNTAYEKGYADGWSKGPYARAASPQATVYSLFSSSDRRNFGHLAPQEFVNAVIEAVRAQATATQPAQTERALTDDAHDAARYQWLRAWYLRDGLRAEIHPLGYITPTTTAIIDEAIDAALTAAQPASGGDQQQAQEG
jgi:hypothetical protein